MGLILAHIIGFNLTRGKFLTISKSVGATSGLQIPFPCGLYGREQENIYIPILIPTTPKTTKTVKRFMPKKYYKESGARRYNDSGVGVKESFHLYTSCILLFYT